MDFDRLADGLNADARRRLWLVRAVLEKAPTERALEFARELETFITQADSPRQSVCMPPPKSGSDTSRQGKVERIDSAEVQRTAPMFDCDSSRAAKVSERALAAAGSHASGRLIEGAERLRFARLVEDGASNSVLSRAFNITLRQANCLRLTILRSRAAGRLKPSRPSAGTVISREEELRLQNEFLRGKPPAAQTMDDVIRFLRQRGDAIFHSEGRYVVNEQMRLSAEQLVIRANRLCAAAGRAPFQIAASSTGKAEPQSPSAAEPPTAPVPVVTAEGPACTGVAAAA